MPTPEAMRALGAEVAGDLGPGDLVLVIGALGAGKTTLVQGIGAGLGVADPVLSPTFVLAREHRGGRVPLVHVDAYRLTDAVDPSRELDALDLDTELTDAVLVVEWGEGLAERLAGDRLEIRLERAPAGEARTVTFRAVGPRWAGR